MIDQVDPNGLSRMRAQRVAHEGKPNDSNAGVRIGGNNRYVEKVAVNDLQRYDDEPGGDKSDGDRAQGALGCRHDQV